jgi:hypothetical protein
MFLILFPAILVFLILPLLIYQSVRSASDVYGFSLPGWKLVDDVQLVYQIELLFSQGLVPKALGIVSPAVGERHSTLRKTDSDFVTGYVQTMSIASGPTFGSDGFGGAVVIQGLRDYRYFWARQMKEESRLMVVDSREMGYLNKPEDQKLVPCFEQLQDLAGLQNWIVISHGNDLVVLMPESFEQKQVAKFLSICESLVQLKNS